MNRRRGGRRVALAGVVALLAVLAVLGAWRALISPPSPALADLLDEAVLTAPVRAVELGRVSNEASAGVVLAVDEPARVTIAYAVEPDTADALDAWVAAYGDRYRLRPLQDGESLFGAVGDVHVSVYADDRVRGVAGHEGAFDTPEPGTTVVTVHVSGAVDG